MAELEETREALNKAVSVIERQMTVLTKHDEIFEQMNAALVHRGEEIRMKQSKIETLEKVIAGPRVKQENWRDPDCCADFPECPHGR